MSKIKASPLIIFAAGTLTALLLAGAGWLFMNPEQCPAGYTQAQVDASNCIVGANIGIGLIFTLAFGVWVVTLVATVLKAFFSNGRKVS